MYNRILQDPYALGNVNKYFYADNGISTDYCWHKYFSVITLIITKFYDRNISVLIINGMNITFFQYNSPDLLILNALFT